MARDPEMQRLVDAAKRERARAAEFDAREHPAKDHAPPRSPLRLLVYRRMHDGGLRLPWFLVASCLVTLLFFIGEPWFVYLVQAFLVAFGIRLVVYAVGLFRGYQEFLRFPGDVAFPVEGWSSLLDEELVNDPDQWQTDAELRVELEPGADREVIEAALALCTADANGRFYSADVILGAGTEPRKRWHRDGATIHGSINVWIIGNLYRVIRKIDWIHRKAGGVRRVVVSKSGPIYGIARPAAD